MSGTGRLLPADDEEIKAVLLDRPIASLTDVAYTYGRLDALHVMQRARDAEFDVPEPIPPWVKPDISNDHLLAMTPDEQSDLFDEGDTLITLHVVLSSDPDTPPRIHADPTQVRRIDWAGMLRHGYVYREKRGMVYDHSLAIHINGKKPDEIDRYVASRFTTWPADALGDEKLMARSDAWIIDELAMIGDDENESVLEDAISAVKNEISDLDGSTWEGILSPTLWFDNVDGTDEQKLAGPFPPGLIPICNEVAIVNQRDQYSSFSSASEAITEGTDAVTGEWTTVLGTTPERPLSYYHAKQQGPFDGFDADRSVQNQTLSMETAMAVAAGSSIIDSCREWVGGPGGAINDTVVHYLPYVPIMSAADAREIYQVISAAHRDGEPIASKLADTIQTWAAPAADPRDLRFHQVIINTGVEQNKDKVISETLGASSMPVTDLARAYVRTQNLPIDLDRYEWVDMFNPERNHTVPILTGEYVAETMADPERKPDTPPDDRDPRTDTPTSANDPRIDVFLASVTGEPIRGDRLQESFADRLAQDQSGLLAKGGRHVPYDTIAKQYVFTNALAHAGLIHGEAPYPIHTTMTNHDTQDYTDTETESGSDDANDSEPNSEQKLDRYLHEHELLHENDAVRAAFLLGGLVGRVSAYQQQKNVQSPLSRRYTIDSITRANFRSVFADVTAKNEEYAFAYQNGQPLYQRYVRRLRDILVDSDPREWPVTEDAIQTAYAAGISYGRDDTSQNGEEETTENTSKTEDTDAELGV